MRDLRASILVIGIMAVLPASAHAEMGKLGGHMGLGYSHLLVSDDAPGATESSYSPGGSLSVAAGVDYPVASAFRLGMDVGFALLGSRTVEREAGIANLDYSAFEALLMLHYTPPGGWGPIGRISAGPALVSARAELATSGGGLAFTDLATEEVAPAAALDVTLISTRPAPVMAGVALGTRVAFLETETWTIISARLAIHY
jgi:hypothetical protein